MCAYKDVPQVLKDLPNWVVWKLERPNGRKTTKVPYDAKNGEFAKSNDDTTWTSFDEARKTADDVLGKFDGIGFMLHGTDLVGIDFDGVIDDGVPEPYVLNIISQLGSPYCEITPSGTGLRVFVKCPKLPPGHRKFNAKKKGVEKCGAEIYAGSEGGRYLTVTGQRFSGAEIPTVTNLDLVYFLVSKFADAYFRRLWMGDASDYEQDASRVDLALLGLLVRHFNGDIDKAVQFFNASVPGHREKWRDRSDYRERTLSKITSEMVQPPKGKHIEVEPRKPLEFHAEPSEDLKAKWTSFDYVVQALEGQFDGWFPLGSPSLLGGSSGSGKTTFMLDLCVRQAVPAPFYGHETFGRPYLVLMLDRGKESHERTMRRLGFVTNSIPMKLLKACVDSEAAQEIINQIEATDPIPELVFIEGMDMLVSDPNAMEVVMPFMHEMQQIASRFHIALVGSVGAPKSKPKDTYTAKRDTIFGSAVWSRMSETIVTIQYPEGDDTADQRTISVLPRNAKAERFDTEFQHGKLVVVPPAPEEDEVYAPTKKEREEQDARTQAENFILSELQSGPKTKDDIQDRAKALHNINEKTLLGASVGLGKRGLIRIEQQEVETAQKRASAFILKFLTPDPKRGAEVYFIGTRTGGFSRKMLEDVSADLVALGQIRKTNGKDAVWSLIPDAKPIQNGGTGVMKWVWSAVPINATAETVTSDPDQSSLEIG